MKKLVYYAALTLLPMLAASPIVCACGYGGAVSSLYSTQAYYYAPPQALLAPAAAPCNCQPAALAAPALAPACGTAAGFSYGGAAFAAPARAFYPARSAFFGAGYGYGGAGVVNNVVVRRGFLFPRRAATVVRFPGGAVRVGR